MANNNGGAWPYHLYNGTKPELKGSYVKCATNPCRMHMPSEHIMAESAEDACRQAYKGSSSDWRNSPKMKKQIEDWAWASQTPELAYANSHLDDSVKLELAKPGDTIYNPDLDDHDATIIPGYPAGTMNVLFHDGSIRKLDDFRDLLNTTVTLQSLPTAQRVKGNKKTIEFAKSSYLDALDAKNGNGEVNLDVFDYPEDSPYSCCLTIGGADYYIRKMHKDEHDEDVYFDGYKASLGGLYKLMPVNLAANRLTHGNAITISGDDLKKKMNEPYSCWEYTIYSNEEESDCNLASRYKNKISELHDEYERNDREIKNLEIRTKSVSAFGRRLNVVKNKNRDIRERLRELSDRTTIIPKKKDIEKWMMHKLF